LTSFFDTTTNLWSDAFLEVRGELLQAYAHEWELAIHDGSKCNNKQNGRNNVEEKRYEVKS
jgi:hypothetical protein